MEYALEYGSITWSIGVWSEYRSITWSIGVSLGILEYRLEYRSIEISECRYFLDCCNIGD